MELKSQTIAGEISRLEEDRNKVAGDLNELREKRATLLLSATDAKIVEHDAKTASAALALERASARIADAERRHAEALHEEAHDAQLKLEHDAEALAASVAKEIDAGLRQMTKIGRSIIAAIAEADALVDRANAGLAPEQSPIIGAEDRARGRKVLARKIVSQREVERWVHQVNGSVLPEADGRLVQSRDGMKGSLPPVGLDMSGSKPVVKRRFREVTVLPELKSTPVVDSLAAQLAIPGLRSWDVPGWRPLNRVEALFALDHLAKLNGERSEVEARTPKIELIAIDDAATSAA